MSIRDYFLQGSGLIRIAQVVLNNAEIKALPTTPIEIVAAPGANKNLQLIQALVRTDFAAAGYTNINADSYLTIVYQGDVEFSQYFVNVASPVEAELSSFLSQSTSSPIWCFTPLSGQNSFGGKPAPTGDVGTINTANLPFQIYVDNGVSGDFTGGSAANILTATVFYAVLDI